MTHVDTQPAAGPRILMVAIEEGRWGPARLPRELTAVGMDVAVLCPPNNALMATLFVDRQFRMPVTRSAGVMARALAAAIRDWRPDLIVPADEQTVAFLQDQVRRKRRVLDDAARALIVRSLGQPSMFDAMLLKSDTQDLARALGLRVPAGGRAASLADALRLAESAGYPVYLKRSFSWAGLGVVLCHDAGELTVAFGEMAAQVRPWKERARRWLDRDWYPATTEVDVQAAIDGTPAMYSALAWEGRVLAGFGAIKADYDLPHGPSSTVELGQQPEMARATEALVAALGATGFVCFDFMREYGTGRYFLLECNPRPNQICHMGPRVGVDMAAALAGALAGRIGAPVTASGAAQRVSLFPQAWRANPAAFIDASDVCWDDPGLLRYILEAGAGGTAHAIRPAQPVAKRESLPLRESPDLAFREAPVAEFV